MSNPKKPILMGTAVGAALLASTFFSILTVEAACTNPSPQPAGFAVPCPVFSLSANSVPQSGTLTFTATPQPGTDYIYTTAYISQGTAWNPYTLLGNNAVPSYSSSLASLTLSSAQLSSLALGTHYTVVWDWLWDPTAQCYKGPGLNQCNTGQWRVQSFNITATYAYSQSTYYTYSQSAYYAYSQSSYYAYSQSAYGSLPNGYYTTNFPLTENPISEGGVWINGGTTGLDWANVRTSANFAYGTQVDTGVYLTDDSTAILKGVWNPNQTVQATAHLPNFAGGEVELRLRTSITAHSITGYEILFGGGGYCQIVRWNGPLGNFTVLVNDFPTCPQTVSEGSIVKATIVTSGSSAIITAYVNGVQTMQGTDTAPFTNGAPGIGFFNGHGSGAVNNGFGFSSFTASNTGSTYAYSQSTYYVYSQSAYVSYAYSQSAYTGGNTITAASCSQTDVQNALNAVAAEGTTVKIPAGNCTWISPGGQNCTGTVTYDQNVRPYSVTIQGQTTCSGTPASSCVDNTTITDNITRTNCDAAALSLNTVLGKSLRLSGITFTKVNSSSNLTYGGSLSLNGTATAVRLDHAHFHDINSTAMSERGIRGVADHIVVDVHDEFIRPANTGDGDAAFAAPTGFGTSDFFFLEDSTINGPARANGGGTTDCFAGGKFVARHNQMNYTSIGEHGVGHDTVTGNDRGCRAVEIYQNTFNNSVNGLSTQFNMLFLAGGTAMIWGNAIPDFSHVATTHINRQDTLTYQQTVPSQGWGYCGTAAASGCQAAGTCPSNWDQNGSNGYACLDQPGRGQGDLLTGLNNVSGSTKTNSVTGCTASQPCAWPRERLEPVYEWNDTWSCPGCGGSFWSDYDPGVLKNRDYFLGSDGTASCPANPAGNCTAGVGTGTFANRPASCTANSTAYPAGNSPGVGYWATDQNTLYVCTATNTWTVYYKPYTYPHPLQSTL